MASSLQKLSAAKAVEELTKVNAQALIRTMEPLEQQLLMNELLDQYKVLLTEQVKFRDLLAKLEYIPNADRFLLLEPRDRISLSETADAGEDDSIENEGLDLDEDFQSTWRYVLKGDLRNLESSNTIRRLAFKSDDWVGWDSSILLMVPEEEELRYISREEESERVMRVLKETDQYTPSRMLCECISSQLLLYRLTATFGPLPVGPMHELFLDGYKSCWGATLILKDEAEDVMTANNGSQGEPGQEARSSRRKISSQLEFYDYKGGASLKFTGTKAAGTRALRLVNYLIGRRCIHTYDGVLAGRQA